MDRDMLDPRSPDFWRVSPDDEHVGPFQAFLALLTFALLLVALFGVVVMTAAAMDMLP